MSQCNVGRSWKNPVRSFNGNGPHGRKWRFCLRRRSIGICEWLSSTAVPVVPFGWVTLQCPFSLIFPSPAHFHVKCQVTIIQKVLLVLVYFVTACGNLWEDAILRNAGGCGTPHPPSALNFPRTMWDSAPHNGPNDTVLQQEDFQYSNDRGRCPFPHFGNLFQPNQFNKAILWSGETDSHLGRSIEKIVLILQLNLVRTLVESSLYSLVHHLIVAALIVVNDHWSCIVDRKAR